MVRARYTDEIRRQLAGCFAKAPAAKPLQNLRVTRRAGFSVSEKESPTVWKAAMAAFRDGLRGETNLRDLSCCTALLDGCRAPGIQTKQSSG